MGCHDSGVILGDANLLACAAHEHTNVFDIGDNQFPGGSLTEPELLYTVSEPGVCNQPGNPLCNGNWHSAGFTWDGEVLILGWEPGGGSLPECEATDPNVKKSWFFYDAQTGAKLGQFVLPRAKLFDGGLARSTTTTSCRPTTATCWSGATTRPASAWSTSPTRRTRSRSLYADPAPLVPTQLGGDLVDLLLQRPDLRVRHHARTPGLEPVRQVGRRCQEVAVLEPADVGVHAAVAVVHARLVDKRGRPMVAP